MNLGMEQFLEVFFEEAEEHLANLEHLLLTLDVAAPDREALNGIFRAAHSIKGSSGMFGFDDLTAVTHVLETLLDKIRSDQIALRSEMIDVFLEARDVLTQLLACHKHQSVDPGIPVEGTVARLRALIDSENTPASGAEESAYGLFGEETAPESETAYGLFDTSAAPAAAEASDSSEAFGPFDDQPGAPSATEADKASATEDAFGFFDDQPGAPVVVPEMVVETPSYGVYAKAPGSPEPVSTTTEAAAEAAAQDRRSGDRRSTDRRAPSGPAAAPRPAADSESSSIRVSVEKIDSLINQVGELVITQAMLAQLTAGLDPTQFERIHQALTQLEHNTRELQESVMSIRMLPISFIFNRFPRVVRDTAGKLGKQVELILQGEHTELDKGVIEKLSDPLTHIIRNSVDHGIEMPEEREAAGKARSGRVVLSAEQEGDHILLSISDDGKGMDAEILRAKAVEKGLMDKDAADRLSETECFNLIFAPGFSTKTEISDVSGRGVGMDVVKTKISQLNGIIDVHSAKGQGSKIIIKVPLTLAIMPTLMVMLGNQAFAFPLVNVNEIFHLDLSRTNVVDGQEVVIVRDKALPLFYLKRWLVSGASFDEQQREGHVVILTVGSQRIGFVVDQLVGQEEVVIKPLGKMLQGTPGMSGATITGDGRIALILDVPSMLKRYARRI